MADSRFVQEECHSRSLLGRQPARAVLFDASCPFDDIVCEALENLFSLACNIAGPSHIPYVSIFLLTNVAECILPLCYVKSNLLPIQNALSQLKKSVHSMSRPPGRDEVAFSSGVHSASEQYRRQQNAISQVGTDLSQLEIIVFTCQSTRFIQQQLQSVLTSMEVQHIKRIVGVTISCISVDEPLGGLEPSPASVESTHSTCSPLGELVDIVTIDADLLSVQNFFHSWLLDSGGDSEYLHIILPPVVPDEENLLIKCDMQERLVNPAQLPCSDAFTLHPMAASGKTVFPSNSKAVGMMVPVHRIKITAMIPSASLCESVIFGMPMVVSATKCWKVDWDELEKNEQLFKALCHELLKKDLVMLGQLERHDIPKPNMRRQRTPSSSLPSPQGCFVLLPAPNMTLLVKSVAVNELMLPCTVSVAVEEPSEENLQVIQATMNQIELLESFNPLLHTSGLFESLKYQPQKSSNLSTKPTKRKIDNTPAVRGNENNQSRLPHSSYCQTRIPGNKLVITARQPLTGFLTQLE